MERRFVRYKDPRRVRRSRQIEFVTQKVLLDIASNRVTKLRGRSELLNLRKTEDQITRVQYALVVRLIETSKLTNLGTYDVEDIANAMMRVANDKPLRESMREKGQSRMRDLMCIDHGKILMEFRWTPQWLNTAISI